MASTRKIHPRRLIISLLVFASPFLVYGVGLLSISLNIGLFDIVLRHNRPAYIWVTALGFFNLLLLFAVLAIIALICFGIFRFVNYIFPKKDTGA